MAIPSRAELEKKVASSGTGRLRGLTRDNISDRLDERSARPNADLMQRESSIAQAEADRGFTSRFLEELGVNFKNLGQGIARGIGSTGATVLSPLVNAARREGFKFEDLTVDPRGSKIGEAIYGNQPFNVASEGGDFLSMFGASEDTKKKYGLPLGLALGLSDLIPGTPKKSFITNSAKVVSKTQDIRVITNALRAGIQASEEELKTLAETLRGVDNFDEAKRLITEAVSSPKSADNIIELASTVRNQNVPREKFLADIQKGLEVPTSRQGIRATQLINRLKTNGLTPEAFYDGLVARGTLKGAPPIDKTGRAILSIRPEGMIKIKETTLLRQKLKTLARGTREGGVAMRTQIGELQGELSKFVRDNLPVNLRGKFLVVLKNANTPKKFQSAIRKAEQKVGEYRDVLATMKELNTRKQKIGFLRKIGQLNSTAMRDIRKAAGIEKPIRQLDTAELDRVIEEARKRVEFKRSENLLEKKTSPASSRLSQQQIDELVSAKNINNTYKKRVAKSFKNFKEAVREPGDLISIVSEEIRAIDPNILSSLRRYELTQRQHTVRAAEILERIQNKLGLGSFKKTKISDVDYTALDGAMKNGAFDTVMDIAKKYGIETEFKQLRQELDDIFLRANEVDLGVEYRKGFFPRAFKQDAATREAATAYFEKEAGDILQEAYTDFAKRMGRVPNDGERWKILSNLMRGFKQNSISLSKTGSLKERVIREVTPETADFYDDSFVSLNRYFGSVNNLIEARRFFGKHLDVDLKKIPPEAKLDDVLAVQLDKLVAEGKMGAQPARRLRDLLQARFTGGQMNGALQAWKDINYLTIMGDVFSALVQLGDATFAFYRAGARDALPAFFKSIINRKGQSFKLRDFGLERIASEFESPSKLAKTVDSVFGAAGLKRMDALGKETFVNGVWSKYQRAVKSGDEKFLKRARTVLGKEADVTFAAIKRGEINENVKFLMFNELADFFPITLDEVPVAYLKHPNGRIFYQMKTYTTKLLNIYRREIIKEAKTDPVQAAKNMVRLVGYLLTFNATAEELKSSLKGDDTPLRDKTVDNMMKVIGFNRYTLDQAKQQGIGRTLAEQILPPTQLVDDIGKDFIDAFDEEKEGEKWRTTREIPVGGELYYWWFGRGADTLEKTNQKGNVKSNRSTSGGGVKRIPSGSSSKTRKVGN